MKLEVVLWPDPVLLNGTEPITEVDEELRAVVGEMRRLMFEQRGVGLAAPQVGIAKRLMLVSERGEPGEEIAVLNPVIVEASGSKMGEEGCLSFPDLYGKVRRAARIEVRYQDLQLRERRMVLEDFIARVFQHELDHLNGEVFIDKMEPASLARIQPQLTEMRRRHAEATA